MLNDGMVVEARFVFIGVIEIGAIEKVTGFNALIETPVESLILNEYPSFDDLSRISKLRPFTRDPKEFYLFLLG